MTGEGEYGTGTPYSYCTSCGESYTHKPDCEVVALREQINASVELIDALLREHEAKAEKAKHPFGISEIWECNQCGYRYTVFTDDNRPPKSRLKCPNCNVKLVEKPAQEAGG